MPDIIAAFNNLIQSQQSAYFAGLIAAFTPCTLAIIPLFLYRFGIWDLSPAAGKAPLKRLAKDIGLLVFGFLFSFAVAGLFLQGLLGSNFVNVTRLILGFTFVLFGLLQLGGKLSLQFMAKLTNPLAVGLVAPWIISMSPCVLPYFAGLVLTAVSGDTVAKFVLFGLGVLTPALVLAIAGNRILSGFKRFTKVLAKIERWSAILIVFAGLYISAELVTLSGQDVGIAGIVILAEILVSAWLIFKLPAQRNLRNYTAIIILVLITPIVGLLVASQVTTAPSATGIEFLHECSNTSRDCPACRDATIGYNLLAAGLALTVLVSHKQSKRLKFTL